jgi:hypothetical protein
VERWLLPPPPPPLTPAAPRLDVLTGESESERQNWAVILTRHPTLPQRMPTDQRAPQRQEGFVDVGPRVVPHAQAPKLIQPGKCAFHDPAPPSQATAMLRSADDHQRENVAGSQTLTDRFCVIRAVAQHALGTTPLADGSRVAARIYFLATVQVRCGHRGPPITSTALPTSASWRASVPPASSSTGRSIPRP